MQLIERNLKRIFELCRLYRVRSLAVFGSILTDRFNENSDIDFLVDFEPFDPNSSDFDCVKNYFDLQEAFENLFGRKVDLIEKRGLRNKFFIANLNRNKKVIYG